MRRSTKTMSPFIKRLGGGIGVAVLPVAAASALLFPAAASAAPPVTAAPVTQVQPDVTAEIHRSFEFGNESKYTLKVTAVAQGVEGSLLNPPKIGDTFAPAGQYDPDVVFHAVKGANARVTFDALDSDKKKVGEVKMVIDEDMFGAPSFYGTTTVEDAHLATGNTWIVIRDN